ncbi:GlsB/YeaQ/YmgE family stress response membrane protein [Sandarakinorhabdus sp. DWP1-3-1]|uniref:GlsB/YeaQ/YmgE family stress response membrane protein n=1 Tax=Sandarakinorhabdus sp. DWP1-3-1 TaxID=2804627 RepID=UPI003CEBE019
MGLFGIIGTAIVGLIVGAIAKWLSPGPKPDGCIVTILIGIAGAFIAKYIGSEVFGWYRDGDTPGWIMSVLGAALLLWLYRLVRNRR